MATPAMFGWQRPLSMLFSGLSAAGQPGGWSNFGPAISQAGNTWDQQQMEREQFQWRQEQAQREQRAV